MNPYGPEIQTEFCYFLGVNDLNSEKGGIYESPPDRYVPTSSPAKPCKKETSENNCKKKLNCDTQLPNIVAQKAVGHRKAQKSAKYTSASTQKGAKGHIR